MCALITHANKTQVLGARSAARDADASDLVRGCNVLGSCHLSQFQLRSAYANTRTHHASKLGQFRAWCTGGRVDDSFAWRRLERLATSMIAVGHFSWRHALLPPHTRLAPASTYSPSHAYHPRNLRGWHAESLNAHLSTVHGRAQSSSMASRVPSKKRWRCWERVGPSLSSAAQVARVISWRTCWSTGQA